MQTLLPAPGAPHRTARRNGPGETPVHLLRGLESRTRANFVAIFQGLVNYKVESRWGPCVHSRPFADDEFGDETSRAVASAEPDTNRCSEHEFMHDPNPGYRFVAQPDAVASFVFGKSAWAVLGLLLLFENAAAANRRQAGDERLCTSTLAPVSTTGRPTVGWRGALIEAEWRREAAKLDALAFGRAMNELTELIQGVDALLQFQAREDAACFSRALGRFAADARQREIAAGLLAAYRRDCIEAGWLEPGFTTVLGEMTGINRMQRMNDELAFVWVRDDAAATLSND